MAPTVNGSKFVIEHLPADYPYTLQQSYIFNP